MNCPRCNQTIPNEAKFCNQCGLSISAAMQAATLIATSPPANATGDAHLQQTQTAAVPAAAHPRTGSIIEAKYELMELLGEGGMGSVYRARRLRIGDHVAIKILHQKFVTEDSAIERFRREAQAAAVLHHPNVVNIYDFGEEPTQGIPAFIVMELVAGEPLRNILDREKRLTCQRAVALMQTACAGVGAAHRRNIVHRDIKPDNFMVLPSEAEGEPETIKVVDFGIAKLRDLSSNNHLTQTGIVMGTPYYMSPEQCRGESLDARSDVYSLAATLYEMIAGNPPFTAPTATGVVAKHLTEQPPMLAPQLNVPAALEATIRRALTKDRNARPPDAVAFAKELQSALANAATVPMMSTATAPNQPLTQPEGWGGSTNQAPLYPPPTQAGAPYPTHGQHYPQTQQTMLAQKRPFKGMLFINIIAGTVIVAALGGGLWWAMQANRSTDSASSATNYPAPTTSTGNIPTPANQNSASATTPSANANKNNRNESPNPTPNPTPSTTPTPMPVPPDTATTRPAPVADPAYVEQKILAGERVTAADLTRLEKPRLRVLRNTVYARHGRIFESPDLRAYFNRQSWYQARTDYRDAMLTPTDKANIAVIQAEENHR
ncbi:MAG: protein kinase [Acidobacteria bacterium]|nr:protein kinase [Acidobacteriota bacterium]